jgi:hypothetical protein
MGRRNPFRAVCTGEVEFLRGVDHDRFFASGAEEIERTLQRLEAISAAIHHGAALDVRHPNATYQTIAGEGLRCVGHGRFDFVLCLIVLQHMAPEYALAYIADFCRVVCRWVPSIVSVRS